MGLTQLTVICLQTVSDDLINIKQDNGYTSSSSSSKSVPVHKVGVRRMLHISNAFTMLVNLDRDAPTINTQKCFSEKLTGLGPTITRHIRVVNSSAWEICWLN